jgi:amidase
MEATGCTVAQRELRTRMHESIANLELVELAQLIQGRSVSAVEVTEAVLQRIHEYDPVLNSYVTVMTESAMDAARSADDEIAHGRYRGPLHGVPLAVKDLVYTVDAPTGSGSVINREFIPGYNATVIQRLTSAGAVITGKLRMTEGAYTDHHPDLATPLNPWDPGAWTGTSSSGSGVATAAGLAFGTLGTDTGGSIRFPASMNGVTGLKPTWGRVSRYGIADLAPSLDHIGPIARSAADCAVMLQAIAGFDPYDPTASLEPVPDYTAKLRRRVRPRVGVDPSLLSTFDAPTQAVLDDVLRVIRSLGWHVTTVDLPDLRAVTEDFAPLCAVETAHAHLDTYSSRAAEYGPALAELIEMGLATSAVQYQAMLQRRREFTGIMNRLFEDIDILLMPGMGVAGPSVETMQSFVDDHDFHTTVSVPTAPFDICRLPTVTFPAGFTKRGVPIAAQFVGGAFRELAVLQAAHAFQSATSFHRKRPDLLWAASESVERLS